MPARPSPQDFVRRVTRRIAEVRRAKGLTQEDLAGILRTAVRNIQRIEGGQNLTLYTVAKIAHALGVRPEELVAPSAPSSNIAPPVHAVAAEPPKPSRPKRKRSRAR